MESRTETQGFLAGAIRGRYGGNWYYLPSYDMEGWLCPALMKYFESAPARIFIKANAKGDP